MQGFFVYNISISFIVSDSFWMIACYGDSTIKGFVYFMLYNPHISFMYELFYAKS